MKLGIMQPYFVPYIGYWQLIAAVDQYVIYDDVDFIKNGWIHRNRILVGGMPKYYNIRMIGAGSYKKINEIKVDHNPNVINKSLRIIKGAYQKAPFFAVIYPLIEEILHYQEDNLAVFLKNSIEIICDFLEIRTKLIYSSSLKKDNHLKGEQKVLAICNELGATEYYNAIGGQKLYSYCSFENKGVKLKFLITNNIVYKQFENQFQENLSIIDVLMFNPREHVCGLLKEYSLIEDKKG